jgi:hypothetical protein
MNMDLTVRTISTQQSRPTADKRGLQTIGLLFALATLIVIGAAGFTVQYQLGTSADAIERAAVSQHSASST